MRSRLLLSGLLCVATLGAACTGPTAPTATGDPDGTTMVLAAASEPPSLDPLAGYAPFGAAKIFDGLVEHRPGGALAPALAADLPAALADGLTWRVNLRKNVRFSDGTPFDATDVVTTYRKLLDPAFGSPLRDDYAMLREVREVGEHAVEFVLHHTYLPFDEKLTLGISPSEQLADVRSLRRSSVAERPVGTGPYRLAEWRRGEAMVLRGNERYIQGLPEINTLRILFGLDDAERLERARQGRIDGAEVPPSTLDEQQPPEDFEVRTQRSAEFQAVMLPEENPVTRSPGLRKALNYAVDRQGLLDEVLGGKGEVAGTPVTGVQLEFIEPNAGFRTDRALADRLLDNANWRVGSDGIRDRGGTAARLRLHYAQRDAQAELLAERFAADAERVGIRVLPTASPARELPRLARTDAVLFGAGNPFDPDLSLYPLLHSGSARLPSANWSGYADPEVDAALDAGRREADPGQRAVAYRMLQRDYVRDPGMVVLARVDRQYLMRESWNGYQPVTDTADTDFTWGPWWNVQDWTPG